MLKRISLALALLPTAVLAQDGETGRYALERTETGIVRLDRETGAVSLCRDEGGNLTCRMAADERTAFEQEFDILEKRVAALEKRLETAPRDTTLPGEAEIEQGLSIMERFMRRFMAIIQDFTAEQERPAPDAQKT